MTAQTLVDKDFCARLQSGLVGEFANRKGVKLNGWAGSERRKAKGQASHQGGGQNDSPASNSRDGDHVQGLL